LQLNERLTIDVVVVDLLGVVVLEIAVLVNPSDGNTSREDGALIHTLLHRICRFLGNIAAIVVPVALSNEWLLVLGSIPTLVVLGAVNDGGACRGARRRVCLGWLLELIAGVYVGSVAYVRGVLEVLIRWA
jgi:hypothetical protein